MNSPSQSRISQKLSKASPQAFSVYCIMAAFGTYFCMYAFRKPFTAGTFQDVTLLGVGYKTVLVASQVAGYTLSKFLGVKFVSEMPPARRGIAILTLIAVAEFALLGFAVTEPPWNFGWLFFNGLPLGMVFGLVLGFLEGRKITEALAAGLCASFILSSGAVKSVGRYLVLEQGVSEYWMPFLTGLIFVIPLIVSVMMLSQIPAPTTEDVDHRVKRDPMDRDARVSFFKRHQFGLCGLLFVYILLTLMRSIRDDFAVEIWKDLGEDGKPEIFAQSEFLVMFGVVGINAGAIWIGNNRKAFLASLGLVSLGFVIVLGAILGHWQGWLGPFSFMVLLGLGMYVPYVAFHTTIFERLIAAFQEPANIGYLICLADAVGYLGYVGVMVLRSLTSGNTDFLNLLVVSSTVIAVVSLIITGLLVGHFQRRIPMQEPSPPSTGERSTESIQNEEVVSP